MRRVTDVTKEIPVSRHVSCSIFSSKLFGDKKAADEASREMVQCMQTAVDSLVSPSSNKFIELLSYLG